ncbi:thioredoxin-like protein [Leucosporidium creatinivorum]|uniref:thioredoxin-dependent peroxiredoxin n=1 Tax=Leucosporidium creatinivorum TaxID=106004 RepID=A0A1Y2FN18_9BASI|nr:thioredoxin-like protein [Leucosporidium creatinivorum]
MAPKRKEPTDTAAPAEGLRRSTRSASADTKPASNSKSASNSKPVSKGKPASKGEKVAPVKEDKEEDEEEVAEDTQPAKKAKTEAKGPLEVGEVVGDVTLKNEDGEELSLAALYEKSGLVIFSYPRANTPGCTTQACLFRDIWDEFTKLDYQVYGLSQDAPKAQLSWKTGKKLQYSLLSDPKRELLSKLGSTEAKKRCHWVIEKGGKLLEAKIGVKPADDAKNTLAFIQSLKA